MRSLLGMNLDQLTQLSLLGMPYGGSTEEERGEIVTKGIAFAQSVLGRELLHSLKYHACDTCDAMELEVAEMFVAKRNLNTKALPMLKQRFVSGVRRMARTDLPQLENLHKEPSPYFDDWFFVFIEQGPALLHGEADPQELFGDGDILATWRRLEEFLAK